MLTNTPTDTELWEAIKQDDIHAFDLLFERYWTSIYSTTFLYSKDNEVCADIVHDIFLNIWQKRDSLQILCLKNYLTKAAKYGIYKHLKTKSNSKLQYIEDYIKVDHLVEDVNEGDEKIRYVELEDNIETLLNDLPNRCREIFILSRKEHLSNNDIAKQLGISKRSVENQITTALKYIRISLKDVAILFVLIINYIR
jgi:RNA polymerase sigma-70 factor (family 1)